MKTEILNHFSENFLTRVNPSQIHGVGLFAIKDIPEGTELFKDFGNKEIVIILLDNEDMNILTAEQISALKKGFWEYDEKWQVKIYPYEGKASRRYLNYSENNFNCTLINNVDITTKDIKCGEEILRDLYAPVPTQIVS